MLGRYERYRICWQPEHNTPLADFGASWTGWCAEHGRTSPLAWVHSVRRSAGLGASPQMRSGFHMPVFRPFCLTAASSPWTLDSLLDNAVGELAQVRMPRLTLSVLGGRVILRPEQCGRALGRTEAVLERALSRIARPCRVDANAWQPGHFSIPLTDRLSPGAAWMTMELLQPMLAPVLARPQRLSEISLMGDPGRGRHWQLLERYVLPEERSCRHGAVPAALVCKGPRLIEPLEGAALAL